MNDQTSSPWHRGPAVRGAERWEDGELHLEFMKLHGLERGHYVLDVGCGSLRTGIPLARYLDTRRLVGIDRNIELLNAGRRELAKAGLQDKKVKLLCNAGFDLQRFRDIKFNFAWSHSLFTHLTRPQIRACLKNVCEQLAPNGIYISTYNEVGPDGAKWGQLHPQMQHQDHVRFPGQVLVDIAGSLGLYCIFLCDTYIPVYWEMSKGARPWQHRVVAFGRRQADLMELGPRKE